MVGRVQCLLGTIDPEDALSRQAGKYHLSLAGEFLVAGELQRRQVSAAVTYGNAKAADVVAFSRDGNRAVVIEVKSSAKGSWVVGGVVPPPTSQPWVFVEIPQDELASPQYFVLLQDELHRILAPVDAAYRSRYRARHGTEFSGAGVVSLTREQAQPYEGAWDTIVTAIGA